MAIVVYGTQVEDWWKRNSKIKTLSNVQVWQIAPQSTVELEQLCERTMQLQLNVMDNEWTLLGEKGQATVIGHSYSNTEKRNKFYRFSWYTNVPTAILKIQIKG